MKPAMLMSDLQFATEDRYRLTNSMPIRPPKMAYTNVAPPRNMTGIFLGSNGQGGFQRTKVLPPFARGRPLSRRVRTPTEERRYNDLWCVVSNCLPIPYLPPLPKPRYPLLSEQQKVELLRDKEERRGFSGNPNRPRSGVPVHYVREASPRFDGDTEQKDVLNMTKQTPRRYTAVHNAGLLRLEYLYPEYDPSTQFEEDVYSVQLLDTNNPDLQQTSFTRSDLVGLESCYNKICKGSPMNLTSLLPRQKEIEAKKERALLNTGFIVKSYRNPNQAEILANFTTEVRPGKSHARPYVPSPYFFKAYNPPHTAGSLFSQSFNSYEDMQAYEHSGLVGSLPGAGGLSRSVSRGHPPSRAYVIPNSRASPRTYSQRGHTTTPTGTPLSKYRTEAIPDSFVATTNPGDRRVEISLPGSSLNSNIVSESLRLENAVDEQDFSTDMPRKPGVVQIGVEDEQGEQHPVDIDETDENLTAESEIVQASVGLSRKKSITARVRKSRSSEKAMEAVKEKAESRQQELAQLMYEHAEIVNQIVIEHPEASENKENTRKPKQ